MYSYTTLTLTSNWQERASLIQKALGLDKARTNDAKMNSVLDTTSTRDLLAMAKKNTATEENKGKWLTAISCGNLILFVLILGPS